MGVEAIADQPAPYDFGVSSTQPPTVVEPAFPRGNRRTRSAAVTVIREDVHVSNVHVTQVRYDGCRCCRARLISLPHGIRISPKSVPSSVRP